MPLRSGSTTKVQCGYSCAAPTAAQDAASSGTTSERLAWASEPRAARTDQRHGYGLVQCLRRPVLQPRSLLLLSRR